MSVVIGGSGGGGGGGGGVCETRKATGRGHFSYQDSGVSQIFILIISYGEKIVSNVNVVVSLRHSVFKC